VISYPVDIKENEEKLRSHISREVANPPSI
jgi:hypothetical protein